MYLLQEMKQWFCVMINLFIKKSTEKWRPDETFPKKGSPAINEKVDGLKE